MSDTSSPRGLRPLELERVQSSRAEAGELRLRLSGRWVDPKAEVAADDELLVVNVEGRRHRFPASRAERSETERQPGHWSATFKIPTWAEPREEGQAALWLGNAVIPVPPLQEPGEATAIRAAVRRQARPQGGPAQGGALSEHPLEDTVTALHAELEQRTADAVQIRAALANAQSELESRSSRHDQLETTLAELRGELDMLRVAVQEQRGALRERSAEVAELRERVTSGEATAELRDAEATALRGNLAAANVSREAAASEAVGLRSELERVGSELGVAREQVDTGWGHLEEASKLLADARALAEELRTADSGG